MFWISSKLNCKKVDKLEYNLTVNPKYVQESWLQNDWQVDNVAPPSNDAADKSRGTKAENMGSRSLKHPRYCGDPIAGRCWHERWRKNTMIHTIDSKQISLKSFHLQTTTPLPMVPGRKILRTGNITIQPNTTHNFPPCWRMSIPLSQLIKLNQPKQICKSTQPK